MKKLILTASLMVAAMAAFGQGQVVMNNATPTRIYLDSNRDGATNGELPWVAGAASRVALYALSGNGAPEGSLVLQPTAVTNLFAPGLFAGGTRSLSIPSGPSTVQVRAWSGAFPSYEAAQAAALGGDGSVVTGRSVPLNITLTLSPTPPPSLVAAGLNQVLVAPVPEPSSIALGLLGLGAIVLFRRRK